MPIYEYECLKCGKRFEYLVRNIRDSVLCPECQGQKLKRLVSAFAFASKDAQGKITDSSTAACSSCASHNCADCF